MLAPSASLRADARTACLAWKLHLSMQSGSPKKFRGVALLSLMVAALRFSKMRAVRAASCGSPRSNITTRSFPTRGVTPKSLKAS